MPSSTIAGRSRRGIGSPKGVIASVLTPWLFTGTQIARTNPSSRSEPFITALLENMPRCRPGPRILDRSSWARRMLS